MTEDQALWSRIGAAIARFVYRKNEFVQTGGSASAHKPILLDGNGKLDPSLIGAIAINDSDFVIQDDGNSTRKFQFQASGITAGQTRTLTVPNASGTLALLGLAQTFSAKQTFSSGINLGGDDLNTYSESISYTPTITGSSSNPTVTYTAQVGVATRIGRLIFYSFRIEINSISGGNGNVQVSVPAAAISVPHLTAIQTRNVDLPGTSADVSFQVQTGGAFGVIGVSIDNADRQILQVSGLKAGSQLQATGFIQVS